MLYNTREDETDKKLWLGERGENVIVLSGFEWATLRGQKNVIIGWCLVGVEAA